MNTLWLPRVADMSFFKFDSFTTCPFPFNIPDRHLKEGHGILKNMSSISLTGGYDKDGMKKHATEPTDMEMHYEVRELSKRTNGGFAW